MLRKGGLRRLLKYVANADRDGCVGWKLLKELQNVYRGWQPVKVSGVIDECGRYLSEPVKMVARWLQHFTSVLNVTSQYCQELVDRSPSLETRTDLNAPPLMEEF